MQYLNLDLELLDHRPAVGGAEERFRVRVLDSPAGEQRLDDAEEVQVPAVLRAQLQRLEGRRLNHDRQRELGEAIGHLLLPPRARVLFFRSLDRLGEGQGLRLRLRLQQWALADLPWELAWVGSAGLPDGDDGPGYLALHRQLSVARREVLGRAPERLAPVEGREPRLLAFFSAPSDQAPLALERERDALLPALEGVEGLRVEVEEHATRARLVEYLDDGVHILHYAGHGDFQRPARGTQIEGGGRLLLEDDQGGSAPLSAEQLAQELAGSGVRLVVLGSCEGARRDGRNAWSGVAAALTQQGIPAVVAMQYDILDSAALAFSRRFYRVLASTGSIDVATAAARRELYGELPQQRDFIGPVLYLRASEGELFPREEEAGQAPSDSENLDSSAEDGEAPPEEDSYPLNPTAMGNLLLAAFVVGGAVVCWQRLLLPRLGTLPGWGLLAVAAAAAGSLIWWLAGGSLRRVLIQRLETRRATAILLLFLAILGSTLSALAPPPNTLVHVLPYAALERQLPSVDEEPQCTVTVRVSSGDQSYEVEDFRRGSLLIGGDLADYQRLREGHDPVGTYAEILEGLGAPLSPSALTQLSETWLPPRFLPQPRLEAAQSLSLAFVKNCPNQPAQEISLQQRSLSERPPPLPSDFEEGAVKLWFVR